MAKRNETAAENEAVEKTEKTGNIFKDFSLDEIKAALKAEIMEELKAENKTVDAEAPASEENGANKWLNEKVTIQLFKDGDKYKDPLTIHVNGKGWQIERGIPVVVPRFVALEIEKHQKQDVIAGEYAKAMARDYEAQSRRYGD